MQNVILYWSFYYKPFWMAEIWAYPTVNKHHIICEEITVYFRIIQSNNEFTESVADTTGISVLSN